MHIRHARLSLFAKEALLFSLAMAAGILAARMLFNGTAINAVQPIAFSFSNIAFIVIFFFLFSFVLIRYRVVSRWLFLLFLILIVFSGAQIVFAGIFPSPYDLVAAGIVLLLMLGVRRIATHNLGILLGIAGVAAVLGASLTPSAAVVILVLLAIYDIIAVYRTRHMVALANGMIASGVIFGFLIPNTWRDFFSVPRHLPPDHRGDGNFMILGSGDIGLPIVLAASVVPLSVYAALLVGLFSVAGLFVTHLLFVNQLKRQPMAALPPIATAAILGYLVALLIL